MHRRIGREREEGTGDEYGHDHAGDRTERPARIIGQTPTGQQGARPASDPTQNPTDERGQPRPGECDADDDGREGRTHDYQRPAFAARVSEDVEADHQRHHARECRHETQRTRPRRCDVPLDSERRQGQPPHPGQSRERADQLHQDHERQRLDQGRRDRFRPPRAPIQRNLRDQRPRQSEHENPRRGTDPRIEQRLHHRQPCHLCGSGTDQP